MTNRWHFIIKPQKVYGEMKSLGITIADILAIPIMKQSKLMAGVSGTDRTVDGIALMESFDSTRWLLPNNFVITNTQILKDNPEMGVKIIKVLHKKKVAGIALKLNRYIKEIPPFMAEIADDLGFPILTLPYSITSTQIINAVPFEIFQEESLAPQYLYENDFLKDLIFDNVDKHILNTSIIKMGWLVKQSMAVMLIKDNDLSCSQKLSSLCRENGFSYCFDL